MPVFLISEEKDRKTSSVECGQYPVDMMSASTSLQVKTGPLFIYLHVV